MKMQRSNERGSARLKFLLVILILAAAGYAAYLFIPIAYQAYLKVKKAVLLTVSSNSYT